ncbi:hypothetical protein CHCC19467_1432 [Bacillus paralicheniformis]|nr:hypothetical protein CHCC19467_1432 [Bacillus paralicheniformis]
MDDADFTLMHDRAKAMLRLHQIRGIEPLLVKFEKREIG